MDPLSRGHSHVKASKLWKFKTNYRINKKYLPNGVKLYSIFTPKIYFEDSWSFWLVAPATPTVRRKSGAAAATVPLLTSQCTLYRLAKQTSTHTNGITYLVYFLDFRISIVSSLLLDTSSVVHNTSCLWPHKTRVINVQQSSKYHYVNNWTTNKLEWLKETQFPSRQ